uniref:Uncharacterized protein n=1 Tax=Trichinella nativa TaxID=6335 RepID=A0A0V1KIE0_9BILA
MDSWGPSYLCLLSARQDPVVHYHPTWQREPGVRLPFKGVKVQVTF